MIGENIRHARRRSGLTQEELAERTGVSRQTIVKWESGTSIPDLGHAGAVARELGVTLDDLVYFDARRTGYPIPPRGKHLWDVRVDQEGRVGIPEEARNLFGIEPGGTMLLLGDERRGLALVKPGSVSFGLEDDGD